MKRLDTVEALEAQIAAEQMMQKGYLVSKSALEKLPEVEVDQAIASFQIPFPKIG